MLSSLIFIKIETASMSKNFDSLDKEYQNFWSKFSEKKFPNIDISKTFNNAGLYSEFGRIICFSYGFYKKDEKKIVINTFYGRNEKKLLDFFSRILIKGEKKRFTKLCSFNGKEFEYPYIWNRFLVNNVIIPNCLNYMFKKPWEILNFDIMSMWSLGRYRKTSLKLLSKTLEIDNQTSIDGSLINKLFWENKDYKQISCYCSSSLFLIIKIFLKLNNRSIKKTAFLKNKPIEIT